MSNSQTVVPIQSADLDRVEVAWFAPLCSDDYRYLGVPDGQLRSNWQNTSEVLLTAEKLGFGNILCPSSYQVGQDTLTFASGVAPLTSQINVLTAVRCGEMHPIMLARTVATMDHMMKGRLTINIISSDMPGEKISSEDRYERSKEVVEILKQAWSQEEINYEGRFYQFQKLTTDPARPYQQNGGPLLYFGGYSPPALQLCGQHCDVYLMWPEPEDSLKERMRAAHAQAQRFGRNLDYGLRVHMIVRDTEAEAREYAQSLVSQLEDEIGQAIKARALDSTSLGVSYQAKNVIDSDKFGFVEPNLWTGVGRARSGCGAALVGSVDQILTKLERYQKMGIRAFIFSGYPHKDECENFGTKVLPHLQTCQLSKVYGRVPDSLPLTPLGVGERR